MSLKSIPPPLLIWMKPISEGPISKEYHEMVLRECYKGVEDYFKQSPYDATPPPLVPKLFGGSPIFPLDITDQNRPLLKNLSQLALEYYNEGMPVTYEFHDLVKCAYWSDNRRKAIFTGDLRPDPTEYYITFQAKAKGDTSSSSSPAITIFQAKVLVDRDDKDKPPVVGECLIKT